MKESQLIDSIATAEMEKETGVVTSLQEADLRNYLQEVVAEFRNDKTTNSRNGKEKES
jgi:hypothetical protein